MRPLLLFAMLFGLARTTGAGDGSATSDTLESGRVHSAGGPAFSDYCRPQPLSSPITLFDVIERALCESPKTRSAWAGIKAAAANLTVSRSAYLPTLGAEARDLYQHNDTQALETPALRSDYTKAVNEETLSLGWVLYDFGGRSAGVRSSKELLLAAQANQDATVQSVFASTAKDYFAAQAAGAKVSSKRRIEAAARENGEAAAARVAKGVAPITDQLQANTALAQAIYERAKAEGDARAAIGVLAIDMSLSPDEPLALPELDTGAQPDTHFVGSVHDLLDDARQSHPRILAAAAQLQAATANVHFVRAHAFPSVQLVGQVDRSNQPVSASLGQPELPARTRDNYIGIKIEVPLFDGFRREGEIHQAESQLETGMQELRDVEQQVANSVWSSVQTLQTDTENLRNTEIVVESAQNAFAAAQHRYGLGVGNVLELLSAQSALSAAEQQSIQARLDWRTARLQLAASLGRLGMWAIQD